MAHGDDSGLLNGFESLIGSCTSVLKMANNDSKINCTDMCKGLIDWGERAGSCTALLCA